MLGERRGGAAFNQTPVELGELGGGGASDSFMVVAEDRRAVVAVEKREWPPAFRQVLGQYNVFRRVRLRLKIVDAKLVEIAEHHVPGSVRIKIPPVIFGLAVMFGEVFAARFHLNHGAARPSEVGILGVTVREFHAVFKVRTRR